MPGVVSFKNTLLYISADDASLRVLDSTVLPDGRSILSSAAGTKKKVYFLTSESPSTIEEYSFENKELKSLFQLPQSGKKIVLVRDHLYVLSRDGKSLFIVDLLSSFIETILIPFKAGAADFQFGDHGLVFTEMKEHRAVGFHLNEGFFPFQSLGSRVRLIGCADRRVVALNEADEVVSLEELGNFQPRPSHPDGLLRPFTRVDGASIVLVDRDNLLLPLMLSPFGKENQESSIELPLHVVLTDAICISPSPPDKDEDEELCPTCFCEMDDGGLALDCGHCFHQDCLEMWVKNWESFKEKGGHIVFTNAYCPSGCKHLIRHGLIPQSERIGSLYKEVRDRKELLLKSSYPDKTSDDLLFYICGKCEKPFFGGLKVCFRMLGAEPPNRPEDLLCDDCEPFSCPNHKKSFLVYKCAYCCNPATERSFGTHYLCDRCNQRWEKSIDPIECEPSKCPFKGVHGKTDGRPTPVGCLPCLIEAGAVLVEQIEPAEEKVEAE